MLYHKRIDLGIMDPNVARYLTQIELKESLPNADKIITTILPELNYNSLFTCFSKKSKNYQQTL